MFEHYEGTPTCLECHREQAEAFFGSQHYQWLGETPDIVNAKGRRLGKLNTMNDFCTNPQRQLDRAVTSTSTGRSSPRAARSATRASASSRRPT